jgi:hypothetical protein
MCSLWLQRQMFKTIEGVLEEWKVSSKNSRIILSELISEPST